MSRTGETAAMIASALAALKVASQERDLVRLNAAGIAGLLLLVSDSHRDASSLAERLPDDAICEQARIYLTTLQLVDRDGGKPKLALVGGNKNGGGR